MAQPWQVWWRLRRPWRQGPSQQILAGRVQPRVIAAATYGSAATETTSTVLLPNVANGSAQDWQPGDVVYIGYELTATSGTVTIPAGWADAFPPIHAASSTGNTLHGCLRRVMQSGDLGTTSLVITHTSGRFAAVSAAVQGADPASPEDAIATDPNSGSVYPSVQVPAASPAMVNGLLIAWAAVRNGTNGATTTFTPPPGMTEFGDATSNVTLISNAAIEGSWLALTSNAVIAADNATASSSSGTTINAMGSAIVVRGAVPAPPRPLSGPVMARPAASRGGRAAGRAGVFTSGAAPQAGPPVYPLRGPVRAQPAAARGGSATRRAGTYAGTGPPVTPPRGPVQARRLPLRGGHVIRAAGPYAGTGPVLKPPGKPVKAQPAPPRGGSADSRSGTLTAGAPQAGPPVYPLGHPVIARRFPARGGSIARRAGTYGGTGPPVTPLRQPIGPGRRQPPPPARGRVASLRGPYGQTGPPVQPLRRAVRARPQAPVLYGRADSRAGIAVSVPFTVGMLTASDAPGSTLTAGSGSSTLTAATAAQAALTAGDQRTGGPG